MGWGEADLAHVPDCVRPLQPITRDMWKRQVRDHVLKFDVSLYITLHNKASWSAMLKGKITNSTEVSQFESLCDAKQYAFLLCSKFAKSQLDDTVEKLKHILLPPINVVTCHSTINTSVQYCHNGDTHVQSSGASSAAVPSRELNDTISKTTSVIASQCSSVGCTSSITSNVTSHECNISVDKACLDLSPRGFLGTVSPCQGETNGPLSANVSSDKTFKTVSVAVSTNVNIQTDNSAAQKTQSVTTNTANSIDVKKDRMANGTKTELYNLLTQPQPTVNRNNAQCVPEPDLARPKKRRARPRRINGSPSGPNKAETCRRLKAEPNKASRTHPDGQSQHGNACSTNLATPDYGMLHDPRVPPYQNAVVQTAQSPIQLQLTQKMPYPQTFHHDQSASSYYGTDQSLSTQCHTDQSASSNYDTDQSLSTQRHTDQSLGKQRPIAVDHRSWQCVADEQHERAENTSSASAGVVESNHSSQTIIKLGKRETKLDRRVTKETLLQHLDDQTVYKNEYADALTLIECIFKPAPSGIRLIDKLNIWLERYRHNFYLHKSQEELNKVSVLYRPLCPVTAGVYQKHVSAIIESGLSIVYTLMNADSCPFANSFFDRVKTVKNESVADVLVAAEKAWHIMKVYQSEENSIPEPHPLGCPVSHTTGTLDSLQKTQNVTPKRKYRKRSADQQKQKKFTEKCRRFTLNEEISHPCQNSQDSRRPSSTGSAYTDTTDSSGVFSDETVMDLSCGTL